MAITSKVAPASPVGSLAKSAATGPARDAGHPLYDRWRRIGGELELFVVRRGARGYRPVRLTERLFPGAARLPVPGAGHLGPEFHRDMVELNPRPCLSLQEHHARLRVLLAEATERIRELRPDAVPVGVGVHPLKPDPVVRRSIDPESYARHHVFPCERYRSFLHIYRELGEEALREFLSMGMMVSYQPELSCPEDRLDHLFHLTRNLVPLMVAIACNSPARSGGAGGRPALSARIDLYRRNFTRGLQPSGIPDALPASFEDYLDTLDELPSRFAALDPRTRLSLDYRWLRLNVPTAVVLEPREIDTQPTLLENLALQAAQVGITGRHRSATVLEEILEADPEDLERSLGSAATDGLAGTFFRPGGDRPMVELWQELLELAERNLESRGLGEEGFLAPLRRRVEHRLTPAELFLDLTRRRGLTRALDRYVDCLRTDTPLI